MTKKKKCKAAVEPTICPPVPVPLPWTPPPPQYAGRVETFTGLGLHSFYWRMVAVNGETVGRSEGYCLKTTRNKMAARLAAQLNVPVIEK